MTAEQKLKWLILDAACRLNGTDRPEYPCPEIDHEYQAMDDDSELQDAKEEVRGGDEETGLGCEYSRHYESKAVAAQLPDGSWIGWTYWFGGGKYGEPEAIDWIDEAYDVVCTPVVKTVNIFERKV